MPVNYATPAPEALFPVAGVRLGVAEAGIRKANRRDLTLIALDAGATVAGVFTENRFCAAPVQVCRRHLSAGSEIRALVINTGIANAGTGEPGLKAAELTCAAVAQTLGCSAREVLPFSTGVILEPLPVERLIAGLPAVAADLKADNWHAAAHGIMTTDTIAKAASRRLEINGKTVTITGISKGAGMIKPNMATMLGFVATDAGIAQPLLQQLVKEAADESFNCITVDGDTSTNDSFILIATGQSGASFADASAAGYPQLREAVIGVARELAQAIVRDGEGATKFITIAVEGGRRRGMQRSATPSATRRWSRPPSLPPTPTSAASLPPSVTPASPIWMSMASASGLPATVKKFWSRSRVGAPPATAKKMVRAS